MATILFCREELIRVDRHGNVSTLNDIISAFHRVNKIDGYGAYDEDYGFYLLDVSNADVEKAKAFGIMFNNLNLATINDDNKFQAVFFNRIKKLFKFNDNATLEDVKMFVCYYWGVPIWNRNAAEVAEKLKANKITNVTILDTKF